MQWNLNGFLESVLAVRSKRIGRGSAAVSENLDHGDSQGSELDKAASHKSLHRVGKRGPINT